MQDDPKMLESRQKIGLWKKAKRSKWLVGVTLFWGGILFAILDLTTPLPTPTRGAFAFFWLVMLGLGAYWWLQSNKLPFAETFELARLHDGSLLVADVMSDLGIDIEVARKTLDRLAVKGLAVPGYCEEKGGEVYDFPSIKSRPGETPPLPPFSNHFNRESTPPPIDRNKLSQ